MNNHKSALLSVCQSENRRQFKRQRTILYQGEIPKSVYVIKKGIVRAYNIAENGEERNVELFSEGDILPIYWLYDISNVALYYYDAFSDTQVYVLSKERFNEIVDQNDLQQELLHAISRRYTAIGMHINALQQSHAQNKIAQGLQYLVMSHGIKLPNGKYKVNMRLTQRDLASIVGVTRETTALELNKLKDKGVVQYQSFTYTVDYNALIRVTGSDEFGSLIGQ